MSEPIYADSVGATIKVNRQQQGLSLRHLAAQIDASPAMVLRWERDENVPTPPYLVAVARALELRSADLFLIAGIPLPDGMPSLPAMLRAEYHLPPEAIAEIRANIDRVVRRYSESELDEIAKRERGITYEQAIDE